MAALCGVGLVCAVIACSGAATTSVDSGGKGVPTIQDPVPGTAGIEQAAVEPSEPIEISEPPTIELHEASPVYVPTHVNAALLQLAVRSIESGKSARELVSGDSRALKKGRCVFLTEAAEVMSVGGDFYQVSFDDSGLVAFVLTNNTSTVQTGQRYDLELVEVQGSQAYQTILGTGNTGLVLDVVHENEWAEAVGVAKQLSAAELVNRQRGELDELQLKLGSMPVDDWAAGAFSVQAQFVSASEEAVTLRKDDGKEITVSIAKLDAKSQAKVEQRRAEAVRWKRKIEQLERLLAK